MILTKREERHTKIDHGHKPDKNCKMDMCSECTAIYYLCVPFAKLFKIDGKKYCKECAFDLYHPYSGLYDRFTGKRKGTN